MKNQDPNHFFGKARGVNLTLTVSRASGRVTPPPRITRLKRILKKIWRGAFLTLLKEMLSPTPAFRKSVR